MGNNRIGMEQLTPEEREDLKRIRAETPKRPKRRRVRIGEAEYKPRPIGPKSKRNPVRHELKCSSYCFQQQIEGLKKFELRKFDRDYRVGDALVLCEWTEGTGYSGRRFYCEVMCIVKNVPGLERGFAILGTMQIHETWAMNRPKARVIYEKQTRDT